MIYNFDEVFDRYHTSAIKYDFKKERGKPDDVLPLWVADMDFKSADVILKALSERLDHGILGYSDMDADYFDALKKWFGKRFDWTVSKEWLISTPTIVFAIFAAVRAFTAPGEHILIQEPTYPPFLKSITDNDRVPVISPLLSQDGKYSIDFNDFEKKIVEKNVKLFILCSPHNPVGRVWTESELTRMGTLCVKHGVTIVSDEIHADFTTPGHNHYVLSNLSPDFEAITVTCTSPTKSFNLAGLQISNIFIPNPTLRKAFAKQVALTGHSHPNIMAMEACKAAYTKGGPWLEAVKSYIYENYLYVEAYLKANLPQITCTPLEGTYLLWIDFSALGFESDRALDDFVTTEAKLWLNSGSSFGTGGENHMRLNIACPRSVLNQALTQLKDAVQRRL